MASKIRLDTAVFEAGYAESREKAKALIENTSLSIAEISDMTGFASQSYFSTAFKNYTGMTPSQYKQASKPNKNETV